MRCDERGGEDLKIKIASLIIGVLLILFSVYGIYKKIMTPKLQDQFVDIEVEAGNMLDDKTKVSEISKGNLTREEIAKFREEINEKYSTPESAVEYLVTLSMIKDIDSYPNAFDSITFNKDIHGHREKDKKKLILEIMDRITRKSSIEKIDFLDINWTLNKDSVRVISDFYYLDLEEPIRVNVLVTKKETTDMHDNGDTEMEFYYIKSSVWELIDSIERGPVP